MLYRYVVLLFDSSFFLLTGVFVSLGSSSSQTQFQSIPPLKPLPFPSLHLLHLQPHLDTRRSCYPLKLETMLTTSKILDSSYFLESNYMYFNLIPKSIENEQLRWSTICLTLNNSFRTIFRT